MEVLQEQEVTITETTQIMKRRRTKRQPRTGSVDDHLNIVGLRSPAISQESSGTSVTEEEKDMANCLILLAQGWPVTLIDARKPTRRCLYECKTCSRCFSSFQALGGHRAGHKKPKMILGAAAEKYENESLATPATRVHECLICGSEFSSGQALGGHMRRHRSALAGFSSSSSESKKEMGSLLGLDLNLPAPPEAVVGAEYAFAGERPMALKVATQQLVHCQY